MVRKGVAKGVGKGVSKWVRKGVRKGVAKGVGKGVGDGWPGRRNFGTPRRDTVINAILAISSRFYFIIKTWHAHK